MFSIVGHLAGALGLFFMGARLMTEHLKTLTNRRLRLSAARWTNNRCMGLAWGLVAGSVMQSMTLLTLVVVSLLRSDLVSPKRAFPMVLGGNVGMTLLVLMVMLDVKLMALYLLGIAYFLTLILARDRASRYRAMATACFGLALMAFGSIMLKDSVLPLADHLWFQQAMMRMSDSLFLPFLSGMVLTVATQSSTPVVVTGIGMVAAGLLTIDQLFMLYCGACLGSSLSLYLLTIAVTGRARQVAMYQVLYNVALNAIFVPLICIEASLELPLIASLAGDSGLPLEQSLAVFIIFCEVVTSVFQLATLDLAARWVERRWPPTEVEILATPQFIQDHTLDDAETALRLVDLEQRHLLAMLSRYLDAVRRGAEPSELREATHEVLGRIEEFLDDLAARCRGHETDAHGSILTRRRLFTWLEEQVLELCDMLQGLPRQSPVAAWSVALVEGIDAVLLVLTDTLASNDPAAWPSTTQLMGDRSEMLRRLRDASLREGPLLTADERSKVLKLTNISEHVFLLMAQLAHEYRRASGIDEAFLEHAELEDHLGVSMGRPQAAQAALSF